jgi:fumarate reductase flavoprotein subunit
MTVIRSSIPSFEFSIPVVVIGGGACGLTAALAAHDRGAEVIVLERDKRPWGSTSMSLGAICAVGSRSQRENGVDDHADAFVADVMAKTEGEADSALAKRIGQCSGPTIDWLTSSHGVPLTVDFKWTGLGHSKPRLHLPPGRTGEELLSLLSNACARAGVEIMTEADVIAVYADHDDRVLGVRIRRPGGVIEDLGCDTLILATCGYGGNHDMVARHIPGMAGARYFGHEGNRGDGILWGQALGAAVRDMSAYQGLGTLAEPQQIVVPHPLMIDGGFLVNIEGRRFTHELANISGMCVPVLAQPQGLAWVIFDERRHRECLEHSFDQRQLAEVGAIRQGDSWDALERACGLPEGSLAKENAEIEAARSLGGEDRFGRRFEATATPLQAPFCAVRVTGAIFHTQGGLHIDGDARVLREDGTPLPNLYAGGGAARSISGSRVTGYLPGIGLSMAVTLGALAGADAARKALSLQATSSR